MAYAMTKQGSLDNCVTYEFICDAVEDMNAIEDRYRTIGTVAIVLSGTSGLEVYIAGSDKQWNSLSSIGGSAASDTAGLSIYICAQDEVSEGVPDVELPDEQTLYLVPAAEPDSGNLYDEYIYVDGEWEKFGSGGSSIDLSAYATKEYVDAANASIEIPNIQNLYSESDIIDLGVGTIASNGSIKGTISSDFASHYRENQNIILQIGEDEYEFTLEQDAYEKYLGDGIMIPIDTWQSTDKTQNNLPVFSIEIPEFSGYGATSEWVFYPNEQYDTIPNAYLKYNSELMSLSTTAKYFYLNAQDENNKVQVLTETAMNNPTFTGSISLGRKSHSGIGANSVALGNEVTANGQNSVAFGLGTYATGTNSYVEGQGSSASGATSHAEGTATISSGASAHAEGTGTQSTNTSSHSEGTNTVASGLASHAEGMGTQAIGYYSHAEGRGTIAAGAESHVSGGYNVSDDQDLEEWTANTHYMKGDKIKHSVTNNNTTTVDYYKCAQEHTSTSYFVLTYWDYLHERINYAEIVGNGTANARSNARALDWSGNERLMGDIYVGCNADSTGGTKLPRIPEAPSNDGTYILQATVTNGIPTYSWVSLSSLSGVTF